MDTTQLTEDQVQEYLLGKGAIPSPVDDRDFCYSEIAHASTPFDWSVGYDVEAEMAKVMGLTEYHTPSKDQNGSGSCGGQACSYLGSTFSVFQTKQYKEKSAKFIYAPIAYPNGGGTVGRDLVDRVTKAGWCAESLCPSYDHGQPPSEAFMARAADITPDAIADAKLDEALAYASVGSNGKVTIDDVAQALRDNKGCFIGIKGSNNGTWRSVFPLPPSEGEDTWGHWLQVGKAKLINGVKHVAVHNSWSDNTGERGWQWISEEYFNKILVHSNRPGFCIFECWTLIYNPQGVPPTFHHAFNTDMAFGMTSPEVQFLQTALQVDGCFSAAVPTTQYYGNMTKQAVQKYQLKYGISTAADTAGFGRCGPHTRAHLNSWTNK